MAPTIAKLPVEKALKKNKMTRFVQLDKGFRFSFSKD
jgi:hypothetical protein